MLATNMASEKVFIFRLFICSFCDIIKRITFLIKAKSILPLEYNEDDSSEEEEEDEDELFDNR